MLFICFILKLSLLLHAWNHHTHQLLWCVERLVKTDQVRAPPARPLIALSKTAENRYVVAEIPV